MDVSYVKQAIIDSVKEIEADKKADAERENLASQLAVLKERQRIKDSNARRAARIEQQRIYDDADWERSQRIRDKIDLAKAEALEEEAAKEEANRSLFMFSMVDRKTALAEFENIKQAAEVQISQDPRRGELLVAWMRRKGEPVNSLSDAFRIAERNYLYNRMLAFVEKKEMSPKVKRYFLGWVSPSIHPRPRRLVDDIKDLTMTMTNARGGQGNQGLADALLLALMTDTVPGLQQQGKSFMMANQPQIARLQVNLPNPRRDLDYGKKVAAAEHKQIIENILKSVDIPRMVRANKAQFAPDKSDAH